ncbi:MAG: hypothetical protein OHK0012_02100 [Synechococcales cyanobacterium]
MRLGSAVLGQISPGPSRVVASADRRHLQDRSDTESMILGGATDPDVGTGQKVFARYLWVIVQTRAVCCHVWD